MAGAMPIVFVHGIRVSGACWAEQVSLLAADHPVATPDLPGHGARRTERFEMDAAVAAVADAIDEVGGEAVLVGHSLGGYVAIATAARHPARVAALVPVGCTLVPSRGLRAPFLAGQRLLSRWADTGDAVMARIFRWLLPVAVAEPMIAAGLANEVIPDVLAAGETFDPLGDLAAYPGSVHLVNGRYDHFRLHERSFLDASPRVRLTVVPGAGHFAPLTRGGLFARLVREQAARVGSPAGQV